jgi:tRNA nucleotidyltransferase (CCA-adding enzyme)
MDVIVCHVKADFDSLGGLVAGARLYPGAVMVMPAGQAPGVHEFLALHREALEPRVPADIDPETITRVVVVDTCSRSRLGPAAAWLDLPGVEVHLYDHHFGTRNDIPASVQRMEPWGSVSSILTLMLKERGETLTPIEATALLLGIYDDTGSLSFQGTAAEDLEAAAWLLRAGADLDVVAQFVRRSLNPEQRRLLHDLLANTELHEVRGIPVAVAIGTRGPYVDDAAAIVPRVMDGEDVGAAFLLLQMNDELYVIGRSRTDAADVGAALRELGGGGHPRAASAKLKGEDPAGIKERLLQALERHVTPQLTARQIMSHPARTISPDAPVAEARRQMIRYGHSGLVVMEEGRLVGVITRRDVDKARHHHLDHSPTRAYMTREVHTITPETPLSDMEQIMIVEGIGRLPVVQNGAVVGIVTRTDVLRALHGSRYVSGTPPVREEPVLQLMRERLPARVQRLLEETGRAAVQEEAQAYVVGGFVRDLILDVRNLDVDILVEPDGVELARTVARDWGGEAGLNERFGTATVILPDGFKVDFATARTESYERPGALPDVEPSSISDDLRRRDFTWNAMAIALRPERFGHLLDPYGGRVDLDRRRIRVLHNLSFVEDPTRLFRAVRFEERFHMRMEPHTEALARHAIASGALGEISPDRLRRELSLTFRESRPLGSLLRLQELGVLEWLHGGLQLDQPLLQGVPGALQWWKDTGGEAVDVTSIYLAALLAPLGVRRAVKIAEQRLRLPPPDLRKLEGMLEAVEAVDELLDPDRKPAAITARLRPLPEEALVLLRAWPRLPPESEEAMGEVLDRFAREWRHTKLEITGEDLKRLGYPAGPRIGEALRATLEAKLNGEVSGREAELEYARAFLEGHSPE